MPLLTIDVRALRLALEATGAEVRFDAVARGAYASDASVYRQVPIGVVLPRTLDQVEAVVAVCRAHGAPILPRGGGTSLAGQACGVAVVVDMSRHLRAVESLDVEGQTVVVQPGIVLAQLNAHLAAHGLQFGPRPSSHRVATLGGMIGNDACGSTAQAYGRTSHNVRRLEVLTSDGLRCWMGPVSADELADLCARADRIGDLYCGLVRLREETAAEVARRYPQMPRRVSGYDLTALAQMDVARLLVGSEGTLVTVLRAELALVPVPRATAVVLLGYSDLVAAARDVPVANLHRLHALEGFEARLLRADGVESEQLPPGEAYLLAQLAADDSEPDEALAARAYALAGDGSLRALGGTVVLDPDRQRTLWSIRESGLATTSRAAASAEVWPGWEDSAVPPDRLGDYLSDLVALQERFGYGGASLYGHFGHGCVHTRIAFDLRSDEGVAAFRGFMEQAADLVVAHGGSLSGEHGDGRARGELLERMYGPQLVAAFGRLKALFDPAGLMNPGKVVAPEPLDTDLRPRAATRNPPIRLALHESFAAAADRCVGIGNCRSHDGGVMCPSYRATGQEEHSTRGRARLLHEMLRSDNDRAFVSGWGSKAVHEALDLCLGCKGCATDCPAGVDMATYKTEFLHQHYRRRVRPRSHYAMGWLPLWLRLAPPGVANALGSSPVMGRVLKRLAGVDRRRTLPRVRSGRLPGSVPTGRRRQVVLFPDTFTRFFDPDTAASAVRFLEAAGFGVEVPRAQVCCGLTWSATGQLDIAARVIRRTARVLAPLLADGAPLVGLEPSCTTALREAPRLVPDSVDVARLAEAVTLGELFAAEAPEWRADRPVDADVVVQRHCHAYAVLGTAADEALLRAGGARVTVLDAGCCGMAGAFGFEQGHYDVSLAVAEHAVLPAVRAMSGDAVLVADGFSCRQQVSSAVGGRDVLTTARLLAQTCADSQDGAR